MTDSTTFALLLPEIVLVAEATLIYMAGAFGLPQKAATWLAIAALAIAALVLCGQSSAFLDTRHSCHVDYERAAGGRSVWLHVAVGNSGRRAGAYVALGAAARFEQSAEEAARYC